jgi:hypothetical protein
VRIARVFFFEVCPLPHPAVAKTEYTFGDTVEVSVEAFFDDVPFVVLDVSLHKVSIQCSVIGIRY